MKVYSRVVIDIESGDILEEDSFEYSGPVALCGSGGGGGDGVDEEYNARMATIAESQSAMAEEMYNIYKYGTNPQATTEGGKAPEVTLVKGGSSRWGHENHATADTYKVEGKTFTSYDEAKAYADSLAKSRTTYADDPDSVSQMELEQSQIQANARLINPQTDLELETIGAQRELLPLSTALQKEQIGAQSEKLGYQRSILPSYFEQVNKGLDVGGAMNTASADVSQQYRNMGSQMRREAGRIGLNPGSTRVLNAIGSASRNQAKDVAFARTMARRDTEDKNLESMRTALSL